MVYNWQLQGWPDFTYDVTEVQLSILAFAQETGEVNGLIQGLPDTLKQETLLQLMLSEAVKTSEIEGEYLSREDVMSSIRNNMGLNDTPVFVKGQVPEAILKSAIAHLYFESIHPFEDGNGRIGRAIAEKALSQSLGRPIMLSLSKTIEANKKAYYDALKEAQCGLHITAWMVYFSNVILDAQRDANGMVVFTLKKAQFYDRHKTQLDERKWKAINKMLDKGADGFEGGMTAKKYMGITKVSKATATRDLQHLHEMGVFVQEGAGRSVRYHLNLP